MSGLSSINVQEVGGDTLLSVTHDIVDCFGRRKGVI